MVSFCRLHLESVDTRDHERLDATENSPNIATKPPSSTIKTYRRVEPRNQVDKHFFRCDDKICVVVVPFVFWSTSKLRLGAVEYLFGIMDKTPLSVMSNLREDGGFQTVEDAKQTFSAVLVEYNFQGNRLDAAVFQPNVGLPELLEVEDSNTATVRCHPQQTDVTVQRVPLAGTCCLLLSPLDHPLHLYKELHGLSVSGMVHSLHANRQVWQATSG